MSEDTSIPQRSHEEPGSDKTTMWQSSYHIIWLNRHAWLASIENTTCPEASMALESNPHVETSARPSNDHCLP
jgi:hypothetical protein